MAVGLSGVAVAAPTAAQASLSSTCYRTGYTCTPGYTGTNAQSIGGKESWAWKYYGGSQAWTPTGYHNCTLYAAWMLEINGMPDPGKSWGNATDWGSALSAVTNHTPMVGSIAWFRDSDHVGYVAQVSGSQVFVVSDNFIKKGGYTSSGWVNTSAVTGFLHPQDPVNLVWGATSTGAIYRYRGNGAWDHISGTLKQVAVGENGSVWGVNSAGSVYHYAGNGQWTRIAGTLSQISVGSLTGQDLVWGVTGAGAIYRYNTATRAWEHIPGTLKQISVGENGAVWGVNSSGTAYRYAGSGQWTRIAGVTLANVSVGSTIGQISTWGVTGAGAIYRYNTATWAWEHIPGTLKQISVAENVAVWGVNSSGTVYRYAGGGQWTRITGATLSQVSAGTK